MKTLYVIGNGFDLHHRLPTSYGGFKEFARYSPFARAFERYFAFSVRYKTLDEVWNELEQNLSEFSVDDLIDHKTDYYDDDPHEDQFNYEVDTEIDNLTVGLVKALHDYLTPAEIHPIRAGTYLELDHDARFINFNYTNTLQRIYQIPPANICHIHGTLSGPTQLVIGHGLEHSEYEPPKPIDESRYTDEQLSDMFDDFSQKSQDAIESAHCYYNLSIKDTQSCIAMHHDFLYALHDIERVVVLGHSLEEVDYPYFELLNELVTPGCLWQASYYEEKERQSIWNNLKCIVNDVTRMALFEMTDFTLNQAQ
ncbi:MAG: hypothetical protein CML22_06670 [Rheinheimera sp.]|nr:hypothetical protein [Rheinheimera sp.]MBM33965.1 hypothetical protein [Rheinheimera sp.]|tara:strand:+ start:5491 stop:6420 length:930 start_codon:yes stop_codon:yes gene_type:complete